MNDQSNLPAMLRRLSDVVGEYDEKLAAVPASIATFEHASNALKTSATIGGTWGNVTINTGHIYERTLKDALLKSAWLHVWKGLNLDTIASAEDKRRFQQAMESPPPFTLENVAGTFGKFVSDPRGNILRGMAEAFCALDSAYKSHDKMKIGVAGLPKRVIIRSVSDYSSWGKDRIENIINALAAFESKPLVTHREMSALLADGNALVKDGELRADRTWNAAMPIVGRGIRLKRFDNGNGHLFFERDALRSINLALAEYYGDVLPDASEREPDADMVRYLSTAVSKDLQYYPTPVKVAESLDVYIPKGDRVLEPSCGCGRLMDVIRAAGGKAYGIEVHSGRAAQARAKGHSVLLANFLETHPTGDFDQVLMNCPFYGKHYVKHVQHALRFLKPGGKLMAILPASARYDHKLFDGRWSDLPVGSFSESGTNINTTVLTMWAPK